MRSSFRISSGKKQEVIDITMQVKTIVEKSKIKEGLCVVYVVHATAAVIINENWDPNIGGDFLDALNALIPAGKWRHDQVDDNGAAHIKAALIGPSEIVVISDGKLVLGRWQNLMLVELDGPKEREIIVKILEG